VIPLQARCGAEVG